MTTKAESIAAKGNVERNADRLESIDQVIDGLMTRDMCVTYLQTHGLYTGHSRDGVDVLRKIVKEHRASVKAQAKITTPKRQARKATSEKRERTPRAPRTPRSHHNPRYADALAAKAEGKRGPGKKLSEDELVKYLADVIKRDPEAVQAEERKIAYWVEGIAFSGKRFVAAWEAAAKRAKK